MVCDSIKAQIDCRKEINNDAILLADYYSSVWHGLELSWITFLLFYLSRWLNVADYLMDYVNGNSL